MDKVGSNYACFCPHSLFTSTVRVLLLRAYCIPTCMWALHALLIVVHSVLWYKCPNTCMAEVGPDWMSKSFAYMSDHMETKEIILKSVM